MWRRLHDDDPVDPNVGSPPPSAEKSDTENVTPAKGEEEKEEKTAGTPTKSVNDEVVPSPAESSDGSPLVVQRSSQEAAKILAETLEQKGPLSPSCRIVLAVPEDKEWLSDMDCFIRKQLEVFCASKDDVTSAQNDRKYPVFVGQVGIRCLHCATANVATGTAVAYPYAISQVYESVREFQRLHLDSCENLPEATKSKLTAFNGSSSLSSVLRKYYILAAKALGLQDMRDGIRSGGEALPIHSQAAFTFSDGQSLQLVKSGGPAKASDNASTPAKDVAESKEDDKAPSEENAKNSSLEKSAEGSEVEEAKAEESPAVKEESEGIPGADAGKEKAEEAPAVKEGEEKNEENTPEKGKENKKTGAQVEKDDEAKEQGSEREETKDASQIEQKEVVDTKAETAGEKNDEGPVASEISPEKKRAAGDSNPEGVDRPAKVARGSLDGEVAE